MKRRRDSASTDDVAMRRLLEVDARLAQQSTAEHMSTQSVAGSVPDSENPEDLAAERYLHWIEALRLTAPDLIAEAFAGPAPPPADEAAGARPNVSAESFEMGTGQIGRFRLLRKLGSGGYGVVFLAHDPNLNRQVALKVPRPEVLVTADLKRRFLREAEAAASLDHPHIVPVFEAGSAGPVCYIVSAFCDGLPLNQWLEQRGGKVAPRLAAEMIAALADAVQHAHDRGVLHRDIKPGNILVDTLDNVSDNAAVEGIRLTDFGLARIGPSGNDQTVSAAIVGTPAYMAPEQAASQRDQIGCATDVYALGATLYHLLTGRPPIVGATPLETLSSITRMDPIEPARFQPEVPRDLNAICLKCLEKSPQRRYASAAELRADLQRFLKGETVMARPVGRWQRVAKWCGRNPKLAGLSAAALVAVFATLITAAIGWWSTSAALATAEKRYWETKDAVDNYFVAVSENQLLTAPGLKPLRQELLGAALDYYQEFLRQNQQDDQLIDDLRGTHTRIGQIHEELGQLSQAQAAFKQALKLANQRLAEDPHEQSTLLKKGMLLRKLAQLDRHRGELAGAMARIEQALDIHRQLIAASYEVAKNEEQLGLLLSNQASVIQQQGDIPRAEQVYQESEEIFQILAQKFPDEPRWGFLYAQSRGNRSIMQRFQGRLEESRALLAEATDIYRELVSKHPEDQSYQLNLGKALANLSTYSSMSGDFETSLALLGEATIAFDQLAAIHPQVMNYQALRASTRKEAGMLQSHLRRYAEAQRLLLESLHIMEPVLQASPEDRRHRDLRNQICLQLGANYSRTGDDTVALRFLDLAIADHEEQLPTRRDFQSRSEWAECLWQKAQLLMRQGMSNESLEILTRARAILDELSSQIPDSPDVHRQVMANLVATADALELEERFDEALTYRDQVVQREKDGLHNRRRLERATTLARSGDTLPAKAAIDVAEEPSHPDEWIILARAHAVLAAASSIDPTLRQEHAQKARAALQQAETLGLKWSESEYPPSHRDWTSLSPAE